MFRRRNRRSRTPGQTQPLSEHNANVEGSNTNVEGSSDVIDVDSVSSQSSCIDLTEDDGGDFIDLTSPRPSRGVNDMSVVMLGQSTGSSPQRAHGRRRSSRNRNITEIESDSENDSVIQVDVYQGEAGALSSDQGTSEQALSPLSPIGKKITCPVCMDDDKQILRSGRRLSSTICGHIFCNDCIENSIRVQQSCPTCRKRLTLRSVHPIFI